MYRKRLLRGGCMKKIFKRISSAILLLVVLLLCVSGVCCFNELRTLLSVSLVEGTDLYTMEYYADYHFDDFLKTGASDNNEYYRYIDSMINDNINGNLLGIEIKSSVRGTPTDRACSAFTFRNQDNNRFLARNYDFKTNPVMLVVTAPKDAYKSISAVNMNLIGFNSERLPKRVDIKTFAAPYFPTDGVNEKGVSAAVLQVNYARKQKAAGKAPIGVFAAVRLVLDYADTVDNAVALIDKYNLYFDPAFMAHFIIADSSGQSALVEFVNGKMYVIKSDKPYQMAANFNNMEEKFDSDGYVFPELYKKWLADSSVTAYEADKAGYVRYDFIYDSLYNRSGILSLEEGFELLENVASPDDLQYSVIYNLNTCEAVILTDNDWEKKITVALSK